jgi:hypothetical protein
MAIYVHQWMLKTASVRGLLREWREIKPIDDYGPSPNPSPQHRRIQVNGLSDVCVGNVAEREDGDAL